MNRSATVNWATEIGSSDTAQAGDFTPSSGTLSFAAGDASESFTVPVTDDPADETDETFTVRLSMPSASANLPSPATSQVNIVDNDDAPDPPAQPPVQPGKPNAAPTGLISVPSQRIGRSIRATYACDEACGAALELGLGSRSLDTVRSSRGRAGSRDVTFRLGRSEVERAKRKAKGKRAAELSVTGVFSDADGRTRSKVVFLLG